MKKKCYFAQKTGFLIVIYPYTGTISPSNHRKLWSRSARKAGRYRIHIRCGVPFQKKRRAAPGKRLEGRRENFLRRPSKSFESQSAAAPPFSKTEFAEPRPEFVSGQGKRLVFRREAANYIRLKLTTTAAKTIETIESSLIRILIDGPEVSFSGSPTVSPTTAAL